MKIGQTTQKVADRVKQQVQTAGITKYTIEIDVVAERDNGSFFSDHDVRNRLKSKGFKNPKGEWIECSTEDVLIAISEIKSGIESLGNHYLDFKMRPEQRIAVEKTANYYRSIWKEEHESTPDSFGMPKCVSAKPSLLINSQKAQCKKDTYLYFPPCSG